MGPNEQQQDDVLSRCYAMSWEDVRERFPYGLPTSLQQGGWGANVVVLEEWRRHHRQGASSKGVIDASNP
jgi:hypothetical protein